MSLYDSRSNPSGCITAYHKTGGEAAAKINHLGFDLKYCEPTRFGEGFYFALTIEDTYKAPVKEGVVLECVVDIGKPHITKLAAYGVVGVSLATLRSRGVVSVFLPNGFGSVSRPEIVVFDKTRIKSVKVVKIVDDSRGSVQAAYERAAAGLKSHYSSISSGYPSGRITGYHKAAGKAAAGIKHLGFDLSYCDPGMFGTGFYFALTIEDTYKARVKKGVVLKCVVDIGTPFIAKRGDDSITLVKLRRDGFDSVYVPGGKGKGFAVSRPEFVVFEKARIESVKVTKVVEDSSEERTSFQEEATEIRRRKKRTAPIP